MDPSVAMPGYELIEACFTVGGSILSGLVLGYICVGLFIYDCVDESEDIMSEEEKQYHDDFNYINLYYDEFDENFLGKDYGYPDGTMFVVSYYTLSNYDPDYKTDEVEV